MTNRTTRLAVNTRRRVRTAAVLSDIAASSILLVYFTSANTSRFFIKYSTPE